MKLSGSLMLRQRQVRAFLRAMELDHIDPINDSETFLEALEQANPRYTGGRDLVRFQLEKDATKWPVEIHDATLILAGYLGMSWGETPLAGEYDLIIALGGARRSPLHRACYAALAVADDRAATKLIAVAGSTRSLDDDEKTQVQDFAPGAETEYDLCVGAANKISDRCPGVCVVAVCEDNPKSGNDGVIDRTIEETAGIFTGRLRVAAVTTRIYVRGLHLDLACAARRHDWLEFLAAGHDSDPEMKFNRPLAIYLSECLTTLRKAAIAAREGC